MRLLAPQEHKESVEKEDSQVQTELTNLLAAIDESNRLLNTIRDYYLSERTRLSTEHADFMRSNVFEREILEREVAMLEKRKREALEPIDKQKEFADRRIRNAGLKEEGLANREATLAASTAILNVKIDELLDQTREFAEEKKNLEVRERHLGDRENQFTNMMTYKEVNLRKHEERTRALLEELDQKSKHQL